MSSCCSARQPPARRLALVVICGLEYRRRERRLDMQDSLAGIGKAMFPAGRHNYQLTVRQSDMLVVDPDVRGPLAHAQHLFNCMEMCRRSVTRLAPLLEQAELRCSVGGGYFHPRHDAGAPFLFGLLLQIDDAHRTPSWCCRRL